MFKERIFSKELGEYESYGIECYDGRKISDICTDYERLRKFVDNLNNYKVNAKYMDYFVREFLEERDGIINQEVLL